MTLAGEGTHLDPGDHPGDLMNPKLPAGKARALQEAKRTLREMSWQEAKRRSGMTEEQFGAYAASRGLGKTVVAPKGELQPPYAHPYYWAPFILMGNPD